MALTTYILLSAVISRPEGIFDPKILGSSGSTALALLFIEIGAMKLGCYLLAIADEGTFVDLVAYEGYKFVGFALSLSPCFASHYAETFVRAHLSLVSYRIIMTLVAGLCGAKGWVFWLIFTYAFLANFFFLVRTRIPSSNVRESY